MLEPIARPLPLRLVEGAVRALAPIGGPLPRLVPADIEAAACRVDGVPDLGPVAFREGLARACAAAEAPSSGLGPFGRFAFKELITNALVQRGRWAALHRARDPRLRTPLPPPIVVVGLPRSGTTFLHRMLALCDDARSLALWEVQAPLPPPRGRDRRRAEVITRVRMIKRIATHLDAKHFMDADAAEECFPLLNPSMVTPIWWCMFPLYAYLDWYLEQDQAGPYALYADLLRVFQAAAPGRRLTLKAPAHTANLGAMAAALPRAGFVMTHRDPVPVVASANSLFYTLHATVADHVDPLRLGETALPLLAELARRAEAARPALGDRLLDIAYRDLVEDPVGTVARVRAHFGLPFSDADRGRVQAFVEGRTRHKYGRHEYDLAECGLDEAQVREAFSAIPDRTDPRQH
jgi:hypothetical protein